MADNITLNAGSGGSTVATDDLGATGHVQLVKLMDGTNDGTGRIAGDATNGLDVDVTRSALPSGASTSANQTTVIGHLDGVEGLLTTIDSDTGALAACASGTELQVDVVGALPAGANAIGKLAANSGVDIGDVDVTSVVPGTGATNLGKAIDTATGATDTGVLVLATRDDALSALTPIEGDNVQLRTDANGALWVIPSGTVAVSNAGLTELAAAIDTEVQVDVVGALPAGNNNIGDVDVASIAAGTNLIGRVSSSDETSTVYQGTTARTPAFAIIDAATSGDNTLLAAQGSGNKIRVLSLYMIASAAVTVRFESGAGGTALSGQMNLAANGGFVLPYNPIGWFETAANTLLNLELSGATSVDGGFSYIVVT